VAHLPRMKAVSHRAEQPGCGKLRLVSDLPEYRQVLLSVVVSTTVFFDLIGSTFTRLALRRAGGT